ncbi:hypothetical protein [Krasilnikovia sp. MM14-A1004]|uniref:hypothetical protein n=1 Tax=Krasilnikovia sp. MM14-A1004 TaxID=3373541 RepID=UPI00399C9A52
MTSESGATPDIRAILDRSALQSYARGHVHVGEVLGEVTAEMDTVIGIPAAALSAAHAAHLDDKDARGLLRLVASLPSTTVLVLDQQAAEDVAGALVVTDGDLSLAQGVWAANDLGALYLTAEPDEVRALVPADNILTIPRDDA